MTFCAVVTDVTYAPGRKTCTVRVWSEDEGQEFLFLVRDANPWLRCLLDLRFELDSRNLYFKGRPLASRRGHRELYFYKVKYYQPVTLPA